MPRPTMSAAAARGLRPLSQMRVKRRSALTTVALKGGIDSWSLTIDASAPRH